MKFLTLLNGQTVHLAENTDRVPKEEFSKLLEAEELIELLKKQGQEQQQDNEEKAKLLFESSKKKGFNEGLKKWTEQLNFLEKETAKAREEMQKFLVQITLATAKKVVGRELEQNPSTLADMIMKQLRSVASHHKVTIYVNKEDYDLIEKNREALQKICDQATSFKIQPRADIKPKGAVIETDQGIIDARSETLWKNIEKALQELIDSNTKGAE